MFTGCVCCGNDCGAGSIEAEIVSSVIRSAAACTLTWTDNGVYEALDREIFRPSNDTSFTESDLPPSSIDLPLDLTYNNSGNTQIRFRSATSRSDKYTAELLFILTSNPALGTAWPIGPCRLIALGDLTLWRNRFIDPGDDQIVSLGVTFSTFTIAGDGSSIESTFANSAGFSSIGQLFLPMGMRLEV